jgi:hypothetical protein
MKSQRRQDKIRVSGSQSEDLLVRGEIRPNADDSTDPLLFRPDQSAIEILNRLQVGMSIHQPH